MCLCTVAVESSSPSRLKYFLLLDVLVIILTEFDDGVDPREDRRRIIGIGPVFGMAIFWTARDTHNIISMMRDQS